MKEYKELVQLEVEEHDVLKLFNQLGPNAKNIVIHILERLAKGAKQYGDFDDQRRDWDKESSEEALDLAVYQAAKLLGLGQETGKGGPKLQTAREYTAPDGVRVSLDGRTLDGMPWVPSPGARVRVVHTWEHGTFHRHGKVGDVFVVREAYSYDKDEACFALEGVPRDGWLLRVVPA